MGTINSKLDYLWVAIIRPNIEIHYLFKSRAVIVIFGEFHMKNPIFHNSCQTSFVFLIVFFTIILIIRMVRFLVKYILMAFH